MIRIYHSIEHCHRCFRYTLCVVRLTYPGSIIYNPTKRALCTGDFGCVDKDGA